MIAAGATCELTGTFSHFESLFMRYTPFAMDLAEQFITDSGTIEISRGGDVLLYAYLYGYSVPPTQVELLIGEQVIDTIPVEYITDYPVLSAQTYSFARYQGASFLPLPLPKLPVCALRYHTVRLRLTGGRGVKCQACFAYLSSQERADLTRTDILINQIQKKSVDTDGTVCLRNAVKYMWSNNVAASKLIINGFDWTAPTPETALYYHTRYGKPGGFNDPDSYTTYDLFSSLKIAQSTIRTTQTLNGNVYLFTTSGYVITNNLQTGTYKTTLLTGSDLTTSANDGSNVYVCSYYAPIMYKISPTGTLVSSTTIASVANVYSIVTYRGTSLIYVMGDTKYRSYNITNQALSSVVSYQKGSEIYIYAEMPTAASMNVYTAYVRTVPDPNFPNVACLIHGTPTDVSFNKVAITSNTALSTNYILGDGSIAFSPTTAIRFTIGGTLPTTFEMWFYFNQLPASATIVSIGAANVQIQGGKLKYGSTAGSTAIIVGTWYFLQVTATTAYVNGAQDAIGTGFLGVTVPPLTVTIGNFNGNAEEIRITNGAVTRATAPPTAPFPDLGTFDINYQIGNIPNLGTGTHSLVPFSPNQMSNVVSPLGAYCSAVSAPDVTYLVPSASGRLAQYTSSYTMQLPVTEGLSTGAFDGRYLIMYPANSRLVIVYDSLLRYNMFVPFCLDSSSQTPCGHLNFSRVSLQIPNVKSGTVYAVNWNILRIQNGLGGILYAN